MANVVKQNPLVLDTDFADFSAVSGVLPGTLPLRVKRIALVAGAAAAAGTVAVTDKLSSAPLLAPMLASAQTSGTIEFVDDFGGVTQVWNNFAASGLTATGTKLYVWSE